MIPVSSPFNLTFRDAHKKNRYNNELREIEKEIDLEINDAVEIALGAAAPEPSELTKYIWAEEKK